VISYLFDKTTLLCIHVFCSRNLRLCHLEPTYASKPDSGSRENFTKESELSACKDIPAGRSNLEFEKEFTI